VCLADFVKDIKTSTSKWIKQNGLFPNFSYWQEGYAAFTHSKKESDYHWMPFVYWASYGGKKQPSAWRLFDMAGNVWDVVPRLV
jgi:formylglycine-generating enzyme required for sulfatase activity